MWSPDERLKYAYTYMKFQQKDIMLDFWQNAYIRSKSRYIAIVKSRRVGWSFICSLKGLIKAMDPDRIGYTKQFVSYNEEDAIEKINYARQFYDSLPIAGRKKIVTDNKTMLEFRDYNGRTTSRLISIPCRPPRGKGGDLSLDEFSIYNARMSKLVYDAALPVISRGGCIEMGSSPLGKIGQFYDIISDRNKYTKYQRYSIPWWFCRDLSTDVVKAVQKAPDMTTEERVFTFGTEIVKGIYASTEEEVFRQEYECEFIDSSESYITLDLIYSNTPGRRDGDIILPEQDSTMTDEDYWQNNRNLDFKAFTDVDSAIANYNPEIHGEPLYLGYDIGRTNDRTSIYIIGIKDGKKRSFARIELKNATYDMQKDTILKLYHDLPIYRGCFDMTGLGGKFMQDGLVKKLGDRAIGVDFTLQTKELMAIEVKRGLEQQEYLLENDKNFHSQIHSIKRTSNGGKYFKYDAERNELGHADSFWSWALATYAITDVAVKGSFYQNWTESRIMKDKVERNEEPDLTESYYKKGKSLNTIMRKMKLK